MAARRGIVWGASIFFGILSTIGVIAGFQTTLDKFSISNAILVFLSMAGLAFIWLDYIFRTDYLRR